MSKLEQKMATVLPTMTAPLLTQVTLDTKKDVGPSFSLTGTVQIQPVVLDTTLFAFYNFLLVVALLAAAFIAGVTLRVVLMVVVLCSLLICYFFGRCYAVRAFANVRFLNLEQFCTCQCIVEAIFTCQVADCMSRAPTADSLNWVIFLAFLMLVHLWTTVVFVHAINFLDKKQTATRALTRSK